MRDPSKNTKQLLIPALLLLAMTNPTTLVSPSASGRAVPLPATNPAPSLSSLPGPLVRSVGSYFTPNDGYQHSIVATNDGRLHEVFFNPQFGIFRDQLGQFDGVIAVAGYATPDGLQHAIVATTDGDVYEVYFSPQAGVNEAFLGHFEGIIDIAGFYSADDDYQHVMVATSDGALHEIYFNPHFGIFQQVLATISGMVAIDAYYSPDGYRHVIVGTSNGSVDEVYWRPSQGVGQAVIANLGGIVDVAGFFTTDDNYSHAIVARDNGDVYEVFFNPQFGIFQSVIAHIGGITSVSGYFTPYDGYRHVMVATTAGDLHEIYFNPNVGISQTVVTTFYPLPPTAEDISPDAANGLANASNSTAGVAVDLTGAQSTLYAVSQNAGVWKSVEGGPWTQLGNSPKRAYCIAVDPNNSFHLAAGEREDDAVAGYNRSGVWESHDGGNTWSYILDPLTVSGCASQAISGIAFSRTSALFVAGPCGVGVRAAGTSTFNFPPATRDLGQITALAVSESKVWARTLNKLLVSSNDGQGWSAIAIPATDSSGNSINFTAARGDLYSLAAFDSAAYLIYAVPTADRQQDYTTLLAFQSDTGAWLSQRVLDALDGTGAGGRRFIKSFIPGGGGVGSGLQLFVSNSQEIYKATGQNADRTINFIKIAATPVGVVPSDPLYKNPVHPDIWSFYLDPNGRAAWIGGDGGVFENTFSGQGWVTRSQGLHTHHAHTLTVLPVNHVRRAKLVYPTQDNDAWYRDGSLIVAPAAGWQDAGCCGDANWTAGDAGSPEIALMVRHPRLAALTAFSGTLPIPDGASIQRGITLNNDLSRDGLRWLQFIQTPKGEPESPLLDAVMLVDLPLKDSSGNPFPGPLGQPSPDGRPVLIRNPQFANSPDANISRFQGWRIEATGLPAGAQGFWASGGHASPVYYLYSVESGVAKIYKRVGSSWQRLSVSGILYGGVHGPAFVNPYNPNQVFVLTDTGIQVSADGGASFQADADLTALLTGSGKYPLTGTFRGMNPTDLLVGNVPQPMGTLSDLAFSRNDPRRMVAASPFTGVFYNDGDGKWRSLTRYLPAPLASVSAVGIDTEAVYVATEGRSLLRIIGYRNAPPASLTLSGDALNFNGGSRRLDVIAASAYTWTATSNDSWIRITDGTGGTGNGSVSYAVAANPSPNFRRATMTIADQTFEVLQGGASVCLYQTAPQSQSFAAGGGPGSVNLTTSGGCDWAATSGANWIVITSGNGGRGNGTVSFSVQANTTASPRSGTLTIAGETFTIMQGAHFNDVADDGSLFSVSIGKLSARGMTSGCGSGNYCPADPVTRAQMAVFLERAMRGSAFSPPPATCTAGHTSDFQDVACPGLFADFITQLFHDGITSGCGAGNYCPEAAVTRAQMAVFLERAVRGASFVPPLASCTAGHTADFLDVACPDFFADFIAQLFHDGITGGCGGGNYCPASPVTRGQMAIFLVKAFGL